MPLIRPGYLPKREQARYNEILGNWKSFKEIFEFELEFEGKSEPKGPIKTDWWNPRWIPISCEATGDHLCIDMDPAKGGQVVGQRHFSR